MTNPHQTRTDYRHESHNENGRWIPQLSSLPSHYLATFTGTISDASGSASILSGGKSLAIGTAAGLVHCIDLENGNDVWSDSSQHVPILQTLVYNEPKGLIATAGSGGNVTLWRESDGLVVGRLLHEESIHNLAFSLDGTKLAAACCDGHIHLWDVESQVKTLSLPGHEPWATACDWIAGAEVVVSAGTDSIIRLWNSVDGSERASLEFGEKGEGIACRKQDSLVAIVGSEGRVSIHDPSTLKEVHRYSGHLAGVNCAAWSSTGRFLATGSDDQSVRIWDSTQGIETHRFDFPQEFVWRVSWSPDDAFLAVSLCGDLVLILDTRDYATVSL